MRGPEGAAELAVEWLTPAIPRRLRLLEARLELAAGDLPDPGLVATEERGPIPLEAWPAVYVLPQRLERLELVDTATDGVETYRAVYALRVLLWVRADGYEDTSLLRKRYVLAVREALLERKQLRAAGAVGVPLPGEGGAVDPASITEDYSDLLVDDAGRTIAGAYLDVNVVLDETLEASTPPLGRADTVAVAETAPPPAPHPAL